VDRETILDLARRRAEPAVSIFVPITRPASVHDEWRLELRAREHEALEAVARWWSTDAAQAVGRQLAGVTPEPPERSCRALALLATPDQVDVLHLPFEVDPAVVVDTTFATRPLLEGLARHPEYWLVALGTDRADLYGGRDTELEPTPRGRFPLRLPHPRPDPAPHGDRPIHEPDQHASRHAVWHHVADALDDVVRAEPRPVVVAGDPRSLEASATSARPAAVVGRLQVDPAGLDHVRLGREAAEVIGTHLDRESERAVARLTDATGAGRGVAGLSAVLDAARGGRVHELVVEEGFAMPRRWLDGMVGTAGETPSIDTEDIVDDLVEQVLLDGGRLTFVPPDRLDADGHIGAVLRW
jgi:hypothetical protein